MTSIRKPFRRGLARRVLSPLALVAVAGLGIAGAHAPAAAQKKEKPAPKANYSKEFIAAYKGYEALAKAATPDVAAMTAALPGLMAAVQTEDDRYVAGQAYVSVGNTAKDPALQLQGIDLMVQSGKIEAERAGQINMIGGQLAYNAKDYAKARNYFLKAAQLGVTEGDPRLSWPKPISRRTTAREASRCSRTPLLRARLRDSR